METVTRARANNRAGKSGSSGPCEPTRNSPCAPSTRYNPPLVRFKAPARARWRSRVRTRLAADWGVSVDQEAAMERAFSDLDRDAGLEIAERSHQARQRVQGSSYFYGELDLKAQLEVLARAGARKGGVFVDLGSGLGKMVLAAALPGVFSECRGVEILPELHESAVKARGALLSDLAGRGLPPPSEVSLRCGDMLREESVADADVVFVFATCFPPEVMSSLETKLSEEMRRGARLVLVSKQFAGCCADFVPFGDNNGYLSVGQTHSKWNLDCFFYVRA